ncbi:MAG: hypothetical protein A3I66_20785 [Burkholderiales bacterium RIFCSPLOWO2_02_FULL_57_36]|nr:MAG: hypothetical protein A3I66_20785 [Burkholderiales bacterium RIFCSPLOWO2_02_FULL_57_36]
MKSIGKRIIFAMTFLTLSSGVFAQTPREQLQKLTAELEKSPYSTELREKILTLSAEINPKPTIPEEARRSFIIGEALFKQAKSLRPAYEAANAFHKATTLAPWWSDAYWNLAVAQQFAGQYVSAKESLRLYLLTNLSAADRRTAQDRLYAIDADIMVAASSVSGGIAGFWQRSSYRGTGQWVNEPPDTVRATVYEVQQTGSAYSLKCTTCIPDEKQTHLINAGMNAIHFRVQASSYKADYACKLNDAQLICMSTYQDGARQEERYLKRSMCEIVGGPGILGYFVLCK